ncbi:MAG TPA: DUF3618 domain-containing protein [Steroidobacter sp.]|jgi:ElaB/YqjD/DUF883 family membrane-anchored ribosome-binding protein|nr:DUF3618 domain-containing protein [Steroidobacter sp.]
MNAPTEPPRDPAELEREASEIRADMDRTLDALERRFSPSQLLDRSMSYVRDHGAELARNVGDTVKQNPIPVLLTAAGLAWLITSSIRSRSQGSADIYGDPYDEERSYGLREKVSSKLHEGAEAVSQRLQEGAEVAKQKWRSSRAATSGRMSQAREMTRERAQQVQQRAQAMIDEQPLVLGALALAAGAILGAALPVTDYENRTVGRVRDRTLEKAKDAGEREYQQLRSRLEPRQDTQVSGRAS